MASFPCSTGSEIVSYKDDEDGDSMILPLLDDRVRIAAKTKTTPSQEDVQVVEEPISNAEIEKMREDEEKLVVNAINLAVKSAGNLTNLLPTGTFLFFQFLLPLISNGGRCMSDVKNEATKLLTMMNVYGIMTLSLVVVCTASCFLLAFSDTVKLSDGKLYHGFATPRGLWLLNSGQNVQLSPASRNYLYIHYRLRPIDFIHALLGVSVFLTSALSTPNVSNCLLVNMSHDIVSAHDSNSLSDSTFMDSVPLLVGFLASFFCIIFPSKRRGFDRPLLERLDEQKSTTPGNT